MLSSIWLTQNARAGVRAAEPGGLPGADARGRARQPGRAPRARAAGRGGRRRVRQPGQGREEARMRLRLWCGRSRLDLIGEVNCMS